MYLADTLGRIYLSKGQKGQFLNLVANKSFFTGHYLARFKESKMHNCLS